MWECKGNNNVLFNSTASVCALTYAWNFDDIASGTNNISILANPVHNFSAPGLYTVQLVVTFPNGITKNVIRNVSVIDVNIQLLSQAGCSNDNGSLRAIVSGGSLAYSINWNTIPPQNTQTITGLSAGNYTVVINDQGCVDSASQVITQSSALSLNIETTDAVCNNNNGSANPVISNGVAPYAYLWSNGNSSASVSNLAPGTYTVSVTDANNCAPVSANFTINNVNTIQPFSLGNDTLICPGTTLVLNAGNYSGYLWQDGSVGKTFNVTKTGKYYVQVMNNDGCIYSDTINVTVDCSDVYFPSGFTPNKDGLNETFGVIGNITALKNYTLKVYDRWGTILFETTDPNRKWDGSYKGSYSPNGTYVWISTYQLNNISYNTKGNIILIR